MSCTYRDIETFKGEDRALEFTLDPLTNITGWTLVFTVKTHYDDTTSLISRTVGSGITLTDATAGLLTVSLTAANLNLDPRAYVFDLRRTNSGSSAVISYGNFIVKPRL